MNQAPRAVPGQTYGVAGQQLAAQQSVPLPQLGAPGAAAPATVSGGGAPMPPPIDSPTDRPGEPLTTGIASGPGPGPEVLGMAQPDPDPTVALLKGLLARYPNADLQALVAQASS